MSCVMDIRIIPLDKDDQISIHVARTFKLIQESGLKHSSSPTSAYVEGEIDQLLDLAKKCYAANVVDSNHLLLDLRIMWRKSRKSFIE